MAQRSRAALHRQQSALCREMLRHAAMLATTCNTAQPHRLHSVGRCADRADDAPHLARRRRPRRVRHEQLTVAVGRWLVEWPILHGCNMDATWVQHGCNMGATWLYRFMLLVARRMLHSRISLVACLITHAALFRAAFGFAWSVLRCNLRADTLRAASCMLHVACCVLQHMVCSPRCLLTCLRVAFSEGQLARVAVAAVADGGGDVRSP
jgi:hypothetical protein